MKSVPVCEDIVHSDVTWAWTPRWPVATSCVVKISSFEAQSYGHGGLVPPWCPHGSTVRCGHPSGPAHDVRTSGSMVRDPQPVGVYVDEGTGEGVVCVLVCAGGHVLVSLCAWARVGVQARLQVRV